MANRTPNSQNRYRKIQEQFKQRMNERTASGAKPSTASVIQTLALDWCLSEDWIREILKVKVE